MLLLGCQVFLVLSYDSFSRLLLEECTWLSRLPSTDQPMHMHTPASNVTRMRHAIYCQRFIQYQDYWNFLKICRSTPKIAKWKSVPGISAFKVGKYPFKKPTGKITKGPKAKLIFNITPLSQEKYARDKVWPGSENHRQVRRIFRIKLIRKMQLNFALEGIIFLTIMDKMKCSSKLLQVNEDEMISLIWVTSFSSSISASSLSLSLILSLTTFLLTLLDLPPALFSLGLLEPQTMYYGC